MTPSRDMFEEFVKSQQARLIRLCSGLLSDPTEAQDAAQEAFVKAYRAWGSFRGESSRETWLYRIAVRHCIDRIRSRSRLREIFRDSETAGHHEIVETAPDTSLDTETRLAVREVLEGLTEDHRVVLVLREVEGLSYEEIARVLEVSVEAVRSLLARARKSLAFAWKKRLEEGA